MIKDLKEFEKLLKLCRKHGVMEAELADIKLKIREDPISASGNVNDDELSHEPSDEELLNMYHPIGGHA